MTDIEKNTNAQDESERAFLYVPDYEDAVADEDETDVDGSQAVKKLIDSREELIDTTERPKVKLGFFKAIENFVYHYKFPIIAVLFVGTLIAFLVLTSGVVPHDYMLAVYIEDSSNALGMVDELSLVLGEFGEDNDGDGEVKLLPSRYNITSASTDENAAATVRLMADLGEGSDMVLYVTDKANFDYICGYGEEGSPVFASFEGAPEWIELDAPPFEELLSKYGITNSLGLSIISETNYLESDKSAEYYAQAEKLLSNLRDDYPEMFE